MFIHGNNGKTVTAAETIKHLFSANWKEKKTRKLRKSETMMSLGRTIVISKDAFVSYESLHV